MVIAKGDTYSTGNGLASINHLNMSPNTMNVAGIVRLEKDSFVSVYVKSSGDTQWYA